jgi:DNA-binding CsgD family transcriptional regulator
MPPKTQDTDDRQLDNQAGRQGFLAQLLSYPFHRFMGYSLAMAWVFELFHGLHNVLFAHSTPFIPTSSMTFNHLLSSLTTTLVPLLLVLIARWIAPLNHHRDTLYIIGILGAVGTALIALCGLGLVAPVWIALGFLLVGASAAWIDLAWKELLSTLGTRGALIILVLATTMGSILYAIMSLLSQYTNLTVATILPLVAVFLLRRSDSHLLSVKLDLTLKQSLERLPLRLIGTICLFFFISGILRQCGIKWNIVSGEPNSVIAIIVNQTAPLIIAGLVAFYFRGRNIRMVFHLAIPLLAIAAIIPVYFNELVAYTLTIANLGIESLRLLIWFIVIDLIVDGKVTAIFCLAVLRFTQYFATLLGQMTAELLWADVVAVAFVAISVLLVAAMLGVGREQLRIELKEPDRERIGLTRKLVEQAVSRYSLSRREKEVLEFWCSGRSITYIMEQLNISQNTVKTHLSHIYTKTGVSSREELIRIIESIK